MIMNPAEKLSRAVEHVAEVRWFYRDYVDRIPSINARPAIVAMDVALQRAHEAAGSGDGDQIRKAISELEAFDFSNWQTGPAAKDVAAG